METLLNTVELITLPLKLMSEVVPFTVKNVGGGNHKNKMSSQGHGCSQEDRVPFRTWLQEMWKRRQFKDLPANS